MGTPSYPGGEGVSGASDGTFKASSGIVAGLGGLRAGFRVGFGGVLGRDSICIASCVREPGVMTFWDSS